MLRPRLKHGRVERRNLNGVESCLPQEQDPWEGRSSFWLFCSHSRYGARAAVSIGSRFEITNLMRPQMKDSAGALTWPEPTK